MGRMEMHLSAWPGVKISCNARMRCSNSPRPPRDRLWVGGKDGWDATRLPPARQAMPGRGEGVPAPLRELRGGSHHSDSPRADGAGEAGGLTAAWPLAAAAAPTGVAGGRPRESGTLGEAAGTERGAERAVTAPVVPGRGRRMGTRLPKAAGLSPPAPSAAARLPRAVAGRGECRLASPQSQGSALLSTAARPVRAVKGRGE
mmetsp:Transcript_91311/g.272533  ORF Transcript_91311/g.272533 Transcript_91311/m.272533 type:complete len:202 (-) Transcript_91311:20-625(-)